MPPRSLLIHHIGLLCGIRSSHERFVSGASMRNLPCLQNAYLLIENGRIKSFGDMSQAPDRAEEMLDASGRIVLPAWCDSHTHLVFAGSREQEFTDRLRGLTYEQIAARGGGILNSAAKLNATPQEKLLEDALLRLEEIQSFGTGAVEIKSGYGLTTDGELKMLRVIKRLKELSPLTIKATFLGAHAYPAEYKNNHRAYLNLLINEMLPRIAAEGLADFMDVFCEQNYFSVEEMEQLLEAGTRYGLQGKVHVNQFSILRGVQAAVKHGCRSVDHLELLSDEDVSSLQQCDTMPVALPGCSFFLGIPYTPARRLIDSGLPMALASDFNPGSAPSGNMNFVNALACIQMKLLPEEALNASTINGAYAMNVHDTLGSVTPGKIANLIITKPAQNIAELPYYFGRNPVEKTILFK